MATVAAAPSARLITADAEDTPTATELDGKKIDGDVQPDATSGGDHDPVGTVDKVKAATRAIFAVRVAIIAGLCIVVFLAALVGWLTVKAHQADAAQHQRELFVQVGRQSAINLTTIDWRHADADVQRILDSGTGLFRDDFAKQSQSFIDVVKQSKSVTVGTVREAGVETETNDVAQILVAVIVKTSNAAAPQQDPRSWKLRVGLQKVGADVKIANVEFVP
jgi:Mce-associated membrane protein